MKLLAPGFGRRAGPGVAVLGVAMLGFADQ